MPISQCSVSQLQQWLQEKADIALLDVREASEFAIAHIDDSLLIPLAQLPARVSELDPSLTWVVLCHHGIRSQQACRFLEHAGFQHLFNLQGGIDAWSIHCNPEIPRY